MKYQRIEPLSVQETLNELLKEYHVVVDNNKYWGQSVPVQKFEVDESRREIKISINILGI